MLNKLFVAVSADYEKIIGDKRDKIENRIKTVLIGINWKSGPRRA